MKLKQVKIKNFRCYRNETLINLNDLTAFIGRNDAGKSTILEALEIFFNNQVVSIDKDDLNKDSLNANDLKIEISCIFEELPASLIIDAANPTSLSAEYLLNSEGNLEIKKSFSCANAKPKEEVFVVANHPSVAGSNDLILLKNDKLKARANQLGVPPANYNASINSSIRQAIWNYIGILNLTITEIPVDKEDSKKIWDILQSWMPVYALFQCDRKSKEDDKEVTDPMKVAINEALKEVTSELLVIQQHVHDKAVEVAERTLLKLKEMNPGLANQLTPDFKADPKWNSLFSLTLSSDRGIPINKRGSGVRRLILLNFFRAEAERRRSQANNPSIIYAFEEPETSQHPDHQILLVDAFKELASTAATQVLITTHTPALGGLIENLNLRLVLTDLNGDVVIEEGTDAAYRKIAKTLGVLPDPLGTLVKVLLCVEGPHDIAFLKNITPVVKNINPNLPDLLNDPRIAIFPLGGGTLKDWVNNNYLKGLGIPEFHIYDRDDQNNPQYQQAANDVIARGGKNYAVLTVKREMENYIHHDVINRVIQIAISPYSDFDDVPMLVAQAVHTKSSPNSWASVSEESKKKKASKAKKRLNHEVVQQMTIAELNAMDPHNEIASWFQEINNRLN